MLLNHVGEPEAAARIDRAVENLIVSKRIPDLSSRAGLKTDEVGDMIAEEVSRS